MCKEVHLKFRALNLSCLALLFLPTLAHANVAIPLVFMSIPAMLALLFPVILLEALVYKNMLRLNFRTAALGSALANTVTTLLGFPISQMLLVLVVLISEKFSDSYLRPKGLAGAILSYSIGLIDQPGYGWSAPLGWALSLVPAFLLSLLVERFILSKLWKNRDFGKAQIHLACAKANTLSYGLIVVLLIALAVYYRTK